MKEYEDVFAWNYHDIHEISHHITLNIIGHYHAPCQPIMVSDEPELCNNIQVELCDSIQIRVGQVANCQEHWTNGISHIIVNNCGSAQEKWQICINWLLET